VPLCASYGGATLDELTRAKHGSGVPRPRRPALRYPTKRRSVAYSTGTSPLRRFFTAQAAGLDMDALLLTARGLGDGLLQTKTLSGRSDQPDGD
jgi:hypothetical protein